MQCESCQFWNRDKRTGSLGICVLRNYITAKNESCKQHQKSEIIILIEKEIENGK